MKKLRLSSFVRHARTFVLALLVLLTCLANPFVGHVVWADEPKADDTELPDEELSEEETRQIKIAERFLGILEKNPRYGTALDRVYGHHVEFGSLDAFLSSLQQQTKQDPDNGQKWMLLGMFEAQRGNDAAAAEALTMADHLRPEDSMASYYLGQAQLRTGQSEEAIASLERAIERKPARADLLEIFQTLGRVHQLAQRTDEAMKVWTRLEALFPDDPRVLEQIAVTLAEEGQPAAALERYQKLSTLVRDDYRRVIYQVTAAELTIKTGDRAQGIQSLETVLADLNPESWLYRDIRRRIEDVFLRSGDQDSLVRYYQKWLESHPEDVEGMTRLARFLATSARVPEATEWMEKALTLAPSRTDLRKAFIDQLVNDQRFPEAIQQYEQLVAVAPGNPDFLRDWGKLVLRNKELPEADRKARAAKIWNQILTARPDDALTVSQVADLFRQNKLNEEAEQLYRRAMTLAPGDPQYREYLGEFLHIQKRSEEALKIWEGITQGAQRNAVNITRLAEVYNSFCFPEKAIVEIAEAVQLDPRDFSLQIRAADYHAKAGKYDAAMSYVDAAGELVANEDERDAVVQQRIEVLQVSQKLDDAADQLLGQLKSKDDATSEQWYLVARYLEAGRRWPDATEAIDNAIRLDPKSVSAMTTAARIAEASGDYGRASDINRTLADIDRRSRGDHLMNVSRLEAQLGRTEEALKAAQELIVSAPGNTDNYEFYAQTCFRLGQASEGLEALRKAVRINPNEPHLIMSLGAALAEQLRTDEAIEVYWRAFEKSDELEDKVGLTMKLTPLYQQINQLDKLMERFERDRREEDKRRELTICLAQAWQTSGDITAARQELESLLSEDTRDTNLLNQLAKLCQTGSDLDAAIGYQRQLVSLAPGHETEFPLAGMLMANGNMDEAREIFVRLTQREEDPVRQIKALDSLITQGNFESAIGVIEPLLAQNRDDWELLYREGVAWASLEKTAEAINRFERILSLNAPYDSLGRSAEARLQQAQARAKSDNLRGISTPVPQKQSPLAMRGMSSQVQMATGLTADNRYYGTNQNPPVWTPEAYGVARMAAFGWLLRYEEEASEAVVQQKSKADNSAEPTAPDAAKISVAESVHAKAQAENAPREAIYDSLYVAQLKNDFARVFNISRRLAKEGGKEEQQFFLSSLQLRNVDASQVSRNSSGSAAANKKPLSDEDLQLVRDCYQQLNDGNKNIDVSAMYGGNVAYGSNGQVYVLVGGNYMPLAGVFRGEGGYLNTLVEELRLAGKTDEALTLLNDHLAKASTAAELAEAMSLAMTEERFDEMPEYFQRWQQAALKQIADAPVTAPARGVTRNTSGTANANTLTLAMDTIQRWMGKLGAEEENALVLSILDDCLTVAEAEARHRRLVQAADTRRRQTVSAASGMGRMSVYFGKDQTTANVNFPPRCTWVDSTSCVLLYQAFEILKRNDVASDLPDTLKKRLAASETKAGETDQLICNQLYLASALWWSDEADEAIELMSRATALASEDISMQFNLANMYESRGDFDESLNIIERIHPRDQKVLQQRELAALQMAERLGDTDRARSAAERLFGLRLDPKTQLSLVDRMKRLGLSEMADAILARAERTATNQTSSLASLMMLYQGQGKTEQASQLAHMLLRKTTSPFAFAINSRSTRNPLRTSTPDGTLRRQALQLLHRSGGLKTLIEQLEAQLERSPDSVLPMQQLIEFYGVTGQKEEAAKVLEKGISLRPDSAILRMQLAKQYEQSGKANEACDQILTLLKIQPGWVTQELYQIDRVFTQAKRKTELVQALSEINMKQINEPWYIINTATSLLQDESSVEAGLMLLEKTFDAFPNYRQNLISNLSGSAVWKNDRVYQFAKKAVLPSNQDIQANPWTGMDEINSYSGNGEVNVFFHQMLQGLKSSDKMQDLEAAVQDVVTKQPGWHGGEAMLALIELSNGRRTEARVRLEKLADETLTQSMPSEACWIIGQELDRFDETRDLAMKLFERALSAPSRSSMNQLQYSPVSRLLDGYVRSGRQEEARQLLLKQLQSATFDQYDIDYASYQRIENTTWAAQKLLTMGSPVDSVRLYRQLLDDPNALEAAARWNGNGQNYYEDSARRGLTTALDSVTTDNADEVIAQLLGAPEKIKPGTPAVDLMLSVPEAKTLTKGHIKSSYVELLTTLSSEDRIKQKIAVRLDQLQKQHPTELSIAAASSAWKLETRQEDAVASVKQLVVLASDHPLETIPEGRRPNSRQRREAAQLVPLWLIARQCIGSEELNDEGQKLAEISRAAAARQISSKEQAAILFEWGNLLLKAGQPTAAEERWNELLDLVTKRPTRRRETPPETGDTSNVKRAAALASAKTWSRKSGIRSGAGLWLTATNPGPGAFLSSLIAFPAAAPQTVFSDSVPPDDSNAKNIPPLTMTQFRTVIAVATAAAENSMEGLSRRAVAEALKGGFPVADPVPVAPDSSSMRMIRTPSAQEDDDSIETEVVTSLKKVILLWQRENYPSQDTYALLKSLVLPENRPQDIQLFISVSNVASARIDCLAELLISSAAAAEQLQDLRTTVDARATNPASQLAASALQVLIGLEQDGGSQVLPQLTDMNERLQNGLSSSDQSIVFLAALRAFQKDDLKAAAFPMLQQILQLELQASTGQNHQTQTSSPLAMMVNKYLAETGDQKSVLEYFDNLLLVRQSFYSRYGSDYGLYVQRNDLANLAQQASNLKMPQLAMDYMGRACDLEVTEYGPINLQQTLATTIRALRDLPAAERYQLWYQWTMPVEGRQTLRTLFETQSSSMVPQTFFAEERLFNAQLRQPLLSNFSELVDAAREANQLQDLRQSVQSLATAKLKSADILLALVLIAQDDASTGIPLVRSLKDSFAERMKAENPDRRNQPNPHGDYLIYQACLQSASFVGLFEDQLPEFRKQLQDTAQHEMLRHVNFDWADRLTATTGAINSSRGSRFEHWAVNGIDGTSPGIPWWVAHEEQLLQLGGTGNSRLFFRYPLTGNFMISMECFEDSWAECNAGFSGVAVLSQNWNSRTAINSVSGHESINRPAALKRNRPTWNRLTIDVRDGQVQFLLNNHAVYQEPASLTSPWLFLLTEGSRISAFRNIQITGDIVVPEQVPLVSGDQMDGWNCSTFGESQPRKRLMAEKPEGENDSITYAQRTEPSVYSWRADNGILKGTAQEQTQTSDQSWLFYHRPLLNGESFEYEFLYRPGTMVAHPTIGRVAFLLQADGVQSHWLATSWDETVNELTPDNATVEAAIRRGPAQLPLKPNDWNSVSLTLRGNTAVITLNGVEICARPMEPETSSQFGIFRYKHQSTEIRNAVIRGDWSDRTLPTSGSEMMVLSEPDSAQDVQTVAAIINDRTAATMAGDIVQTARSLPADEAFDYLADWVLPSATHNNLRLFYAKLPPVDTGEAFGQILCPAAELVRLAGQQNKMEQLQSRIVQLTPGNSLQQRNRNAFQALMALESSARGNGIKQGGIKQGASQASIDGSIQASLKEIWNVVQQPYPPNTPAEERTAEFIVAWKAGQHPAYWSIGEDIARKLRDYERNNKQESRSGQFQRDVHALVGDIQRFARSLPQTDNAVADSEAAVAPVSQWTQVPYLKPEHRATGQRPSTWLISRGSAQHLPAETWGQLYFQSPLRGQFEIVADRTTHGHKEVSIVWGMHSAEPRHDLKAVRVARVMHSSKDISKEVTLPQWDQLAEFRIVVDGRKVTTWTNGVQIHEQIFDTDPDPWLLIQAHSASSYARVSNLRILGAPEIPAEIDLINIAGLTSWRADMYGEWFRTEEDNDKNQTVPWRRIGDELVAQVSKLQGGDFRESLLTYQRPMLEDGLIEFETWYEPGAFEVHPSLGQQAFVLTPDGVRLHRLTNAQYQTGDLHPENQQLIPDAASNLTLKENDWNQVQLALQSDVVTISVNGIVAATVPVTESPAERQFGLFRFATKTGSRIRKLIYRGDWPKSLPAITDQQLAMPTADSTPSNWTTVVDADLTLPAEKLKSMQIALRGPEDRRTATAEGLQLQMHDSKQWSDNPGISLKQPIHGDCEITVAYKNVSILPQKTGWGVSFVFDVVLDDERKSRIECNVSLNSQQQLRHTTQLLRNTLAGGHQTVDQQFLTPAAASGRLRLVRRGGQIDCLAAAEDSDQFRLLNSIAVGNAGIREVNCGGKGSDDVARVDVTLTNLTIRQPSSPAVAQK